MKLSEENFLSPKNGQILAVFGVWGQGLEKVSIVRRCGNLQLSSCKNCIKIHATFVVVAVLQFFEELFLCDILYNVLYSLLCLERCFLETL